jgi:monoamine oxidase
VTLTLSRRRLLEGAITGLLAGMSSGCSQPSSGRSVVVVGAGLSGLNAALILERWGYEVRVIEAKERVGGRLWTLDHMPGSPEGGGNVMGANYGRVFHMAHELNVSLRTPARTLPVDYFIGNQRIARNDWTTSSANPLSEAWRAITPDRLLGKLNTTNPLLGTRAWHDPVLMAGDQSAAAGLRALGFPDAAIELIGSNNSYGNNLNETSLMTLYRIMGEFARLSGPALSVKEAVEGNMRLPEAMAMNLARPVRKGEPVTAIHQSASKVAVTVESGRSLEADAVVLALPLPALRQIEVSLPSSQQALLEDIDYHKVVQLHCIVEEPFWKSSGWSGSWWTDGPLGRVFTRPILGTSRHNMTVWINGDDCDALNSLDDATCTETLTQALWKLMPSARDVTSVGQLVRWSTDRYAGGAWALWRPGQAATAHEAIRTPAGRLFFAGEHTAEAYRGMEAAMESGERAALEVMRLLA